MKRAVSLWLLDKVDPPTESFIDGMLAEALPKTGKTSVILLVSGHPARPNKPYRYGRAICVPRLLTRRHVARFLNFPLACWLLVRLRRRMSRQGRRCAWLVRNEPVYLAAAVCARRKDTPVIYQQSFPHDDFCRNPVKRGVARLILRSCRRGVNGLLAVSPLGLRRLSGQFPDAVKGAVIPLLAPSPALTNPLPAPTPHSPCECVYIGTHEPARQLDVVLEGVRQAVAEGVDVRATFIGGHPDDVTRLRRSPGVSSLEAQDRLRFVSPSPRAQLLEQLPAFDVGLSLIPPTDIFRESSPTKLTEYLGAGLTVLASSGIPLQEQFVTESGAGELVRFDPAAIAVGLGQLATETQRCHASRRRAARDYALRQLTYDQHVDALLDWVGDDQN
ncbi:glycosyltransferase [Spiribacter salinus]|uniref:glycosyltransferase n=1 Tax=Spiribacter salinus TaxID=1335746 RepID=UPI001C945CF7|nr:glycosyltransferase [Spiribacter salinus]MBY5268833.1 hypothetical protein [Spiribacter salinus]